MFKIMETPRIYVGTYAKYNEGSLFGEWLDLDDYSSKDEFYEACQELHKDEEDAEFMFQDWENIPADFIGESWISEKFWDYIETLSDVDEDAFTAYVEHMGFDLDKTDVSDIVRDFEEAFCGEYKDEEDFAYQLLEDTGDLNQIPKHLQFYFDYEKFARDLFMSDYFMVDTYVFRNI
jgi:antirestriction protein